MAERQRPGRKFGTTLAQVEQRKRLVFEMMLQGMRPQNIVDLITANANIRPPKDMPPVELQKDPWRKYRAELDWGVGFDQVCEYFSDALAKLREVNLIDGQAEFRKAVMRNDELYRRALQAGDLSTCRQLENDRRKLLQLDAFEHGQQKAAGPVVERPAIELPGGIFLEI